MRLVVDLDGVVTNTPKKIFQLFPQWDWSYDNLPNYIYDSFQNPEFYLSLEPIPSSLSFLLKWKKLIDIIFVSNRPISTEVSKTWLEKHGYTNPVIHHVKSLEDKYSLTAELKAIGLIDDAPHHLIPAPFIRFIYSWPYNLQYYTTITEEFSEGKYQSVYRIYNLKDLEGALVKYFQRV